MTSSNFFFVFFSDFFFSSELPIGRGVRHGRVGNTGGKVTGDVRQEPRYRIVARLHKTKRTTNSNNNDSNYNGTSPSPTHWHRPISQRHQGRQEQQLKWQLRERWPSTCSCRSHTLSYQLPLKLWDRSVTLVSSFSATLLARHKVSIACSASSYGGVIAWKNSCSYLGVYFVSGRVFKCSSDIWYFWSFNAILSKVGRFISEKVVISLIYAKCRPVLLCSTEAFRILLRDKRSLEYLLLLDHWWSYFELARQTLSKTVRIFFVCYQLVLW